jgi:hypothetical protein
VWGIMDNTNILKYKLSITPYNQSTIIKLIWILKQHQSKT